MNNLQTPLSEEQKKNLENIGIDMNICYLCYRY